MDARGATEAPSTRKRQRSGPKPPVIARGSAAPPPPCTSQQSGGMVLTQVRKRPPRDASSSGSSSSESGEIRPSPRSLPSLTVQGQNSPTREEPGHEEGTARPSPPPPTAPPVYPNRYPALGTFSLPCPDPKAPAPTSRFDINPPEFSMEARAPAYVYYRSLEVQTNATFSNDAVDGASIGPSSRMTGTLYP